MGYAFLHGQNGGGNLLRLKVVGSTSAPSNPKENTIWIKTSVPILENQVFFNEQTSGDFWKGQGNGSVYIPFQAAKSSYWASTGANITVPKGNLCEFNVNFLGCKQLINDEWVNMDAYIYHGSSWVQFSSTWDGSFYSGGQYIKITGFNINYGSTSGPDLTVSNDGSKLTFSMGADSSDRRVGTAYTKEKIDLTDFNTININVLSGSAAHNGSNTGISIRSSVPTYNGNEITNSAAFKTFGSYTPSGTYSIDVSSFSGEYYFCIHLYTQYSDSSSLYVDRIWVA